MDRELDVLAVLLTLAEELLVVRAGLVVAEAERVGMPKALQIEALVAPGVGAIEERTMRR